MSRQSTAAARNLTLTEELEKLEQSITLTLQEIDHNFSRAHRIVTSGILPVVEQYAKHSEAVWEGSKFWKQFFEASANVSLTGYEEAAGGDEDGTYAEHVTTAGSSAFGSRTVTPVDGSEGLGGDEEGEDADDDGGGGVGRDIDESLLTSPSVAHATSTPRLPTASKTRGKATRQPQFADYPSPYESLKRELQASSSPTQPPPEPTIAIDDPVTPGRASALPDMSMTPDSSPFAIAPTTTEQQRGTKVNTDPLLHRILDKNYRVAATPHTQRSKHPHQPRPKPSAATTPATSTKAAATTTTTTTTRTLALDSDLDSSPDVPAPQLRADLFSPAKLRPSRTPGISVQTPSAKRQIRKSLDARARPPAKADNSTQQTRDIFGRGPKPGNPWDSDDDDDDDDDDANDAFSPPKTMQFHIPQSRILQTPAREASRRIVEDLMLTAGGDITDEDDEDDGGATRRAGVEDSPSLVRRDGALDDSF